jgi:hypothetical protein
MSLRLVMASELDFTPAGKRRVRVVPTSRGGRLLRWYVSGRRYHSLPVTPAAAELSREWVANAGADNHRPQTWEAFV